jgi:hypothetical protein
VEGVRPSSSVIALGQRKDGSVETPADRQNSVRGDATETSPTAETRPGEVHELRPIDKLKVCTSCLVTNSSDNLFCTACGEKLPETVIGEEATPLSKSAYPTVVEGATGLDALSAEASAADAGAAEEMAAQERWPLPAREDKLVAHPYVPVSADLVARGRRRWPLIAVLVAVLAGTVVLGVLWRLQASDAQHLRRTLHATRLRLASSQSDLSRTKQTLAATSSKSEKRRQALVQTQDVLAQVDPLLSSVDGVQNKAGALGDQGSTISSDAEAFIGTVADLVNYMLQPGTNDYTYVGQQVDTANSELATMRADEGLFGDANSAYGTASTAFGSKASAFTQSVRALQKQLKGAVGGTP